MADLAATANRSIPSLVLPASGFLFTAWFALREGWTLPEFCWSTWLAGLLFAWVSVLTAVLEIPLRARPAWDQLEARLPNAPPLPGPVKPLLVAVAGCLAGAFFFNAYSWLFGFYGLFLSVFATMEPQYYFGPNGFINSDFYGPVLHLLKNFWPMAAGVVISNAAVLWQCPPWRRLALPFRSNRILRIHLMVMLLPFVALAAWALLGEAYHGLAILLLLALFYFIPSSEEKIASKVSEGV
jgi:hypothetical protein